MTIRQKIKSEIRSAHWAKDTSNTTAYWLHIETIRHLYPLRNRVGVT